MCLYGVCCICKGYPWKPTTTTAKPSALCYDCDYDPDDAQVEDDKAAEKPHDHGDGWAGYGGATTTKATPGYGKKKGGRRGFPRCALDSGDERFVRLTECHSSICFIRRDHNGRQYTPNSHETLALSLCFHIVCFNSG